MSRDNLETNGQEGLGSAHLRRWRHRLLNDPYRPAYHFVVPEGVCLPADPNGAIYWNGRYHLGYIYQDEV